MDMTSSVYEPIGNESDVTTSTFNVSVDGPIIKSIEHLVSVSVILGLMILFTIIGNVFVIAAIILEKNLHNVANYLILSLAVADLMVASIVMPISAVNEVSMKWFFRSEICVMWTTMDVLCCTASILHLVAISIDRYWAVTNIDYTRTRTAKRILVMIAILWFVAMLITIPPLFGWRDDNDPTVTGVCEISQNTGYQVFSTLGAFYIPTILMLIIYIKIFFVARERIRKKRFAQAAKLQQRQTTTQQGTEMTLLSVPHKSSPVSRSEVSEAPCNGSSESHDDNDNRCKENGHVEDDPRSCMIPKGGCEILRAKKHKEKLEAKRERKAARTLGIITGVYIVCWLPFFILAIVNPFIRHIKQIPGPLSSVVLWLGYVNSLLNPIIYTVFNPEFRAAFHKILFGKYSRKNRRRAQR
ncbi:5HTR-like protein [Mya arenaria]|uniref:5HTR-like protein n=1 Tax=Mya arenaria TaxID=6604 RepID=A0ABY7DA16_MYAAR|nr:5-hydroxytryptamine receptor-like [Mya arenaria]XP_052812412.1 5-hydroxytryptamine receptor-like [Mya arenaria]XP_052812479.1 5-hydroxytryptamine receptor-like [Mya arenaria]WAQ94492.1 5HTR-like protein [Mya arenaria]